MSTEKIPNDYKIRLTLCNEKGEMIGEAVMGMDFLEARREHYNESGLDFNLDEIWKQYLNGLEPAHKEIILRKNGNERSTKDEV